MMESEIWIRPLGVEEACQAARLERECFPEPWSERSLQDMIKSPYTLYLAAECEGRVVAYCGTQMVLDEGDILRIAVEENMRGRQVGSALLEYLWEHTKTIAVWNLDVRAGNKRAIALYQKYGFVSIGIRKNYYHDPLEDAVLMQRKC